MMDLLSCFSMKRMVHLPRRVTVYKESTAERQGTLAQHVPL